MTHSRMLTVRAIAQYLASRDRYHWSLQPNRAQIAKQAIYIKKGVAIVEICEKNMATYSWLPNRDMTPRTSWEKATLG